MSARVTIWNENVHELTEPDIAAVYPLGIHGTIAAGLRAHGFDPRTATLAEAEHGLSEEVLAATDVLVWWGHIAHDRVSDEIVDRVQRHVLSGMGLIVLHSGHFSKIFIRLMGTTCSLAWRDDGDRELAWVTSPGHPIAAGIDSPLVLEAHETYGEHFDIPEPSATIFISSFDGGEVFRSGVTFERGRGRIFYFSPGDQKYPIYHNEQIIRVIANAIGWAAPTNERELPAVRHTTKR